MTLTLGEFIAGASLVLAVTTFFVTALRYQNERQQKQIDLIDKKISAVKTDFDSRIQLHLDRLLRHQERTSAMELKLLGMVGNFPTREQMTDTMDRALEPIAEQIERLTTIVDDGLRNGSFNRSPRR